MLYGWQYTGILFLQILAFSCWKDTFCIWHVWWDFTLVLPLSCWYIQLMDYVAAFAHNHAKSCSLWTADLSLSAQEGPTPKVYSGPSIQAQFQFMFYIETQVFPRPWVFCRGLSPCFSPTSTPGPATGSTLLPTAPHQVSLLQKAPDPFPSTAHNSIVQAEMSVWNRLCLALEGIDYPLTFLFSFYLDSVHFRSFPILS